MEKKKKRGRPIKTGAKRNSICLKLSDDEYMMLSEIASDYGLTKQDYIRSKVFSFGER